MEDLKGVNVLPKEVSAKESKWDRWYKAYNAENRSTFKSFLKVGKFQIFVLLTLITVSFVLTVLLIGNGAYVYNAATYDKIENAMTDFVKSDRSEKELKVLEEKIKAINVNAGNISYNCKTNGARKLICSTKNGFFHAQVTMKWVENSESTYMPVPKRNFADRNAYTIWFYIAFGSCSIGGGILVWIIINLMLDFIPFLCAKLYEACQKFKSNRQNKQLIKKDKKGERAA